MYLKVGIVYTFTCDLLMQNRSANIRIQRFSDFLVLIILSFTTKFNLFRLLNFNVFTQWAAICHLSNRKTDKIKYKRNVQHFYYLNIFDVYKYCVHL